MKLRHIFIIVVFLIIPNVFLGILFEFSGAQIFTNICSSISIFLLAHYFISLKEVEELHLKLWLANRGIYLLTERIDKIRSKLISRGIYFFDE